MTARRSPAAIASAKLYGRKPADELGLYDDRLTIKGKGRVSSVRFELTGGASVEVRHQGDHVEVRCDAGGLVIKPNVSNSIDVTAARRT